MSDYVIFECTRCKEGYKNTQPTEKGIRLREEHRLCGKCSRLHGEFLQGSLLVSEVKDKEKKHVKST